MDQVGFGALIKLTKNFIYSAKLRRNMKTRTQIRQELVDREIFVVIGAKHTNSANYTLELAKAIHESGYIPEITYRIPLEIFEPSAELLNAYKKENPEFIFGIGSIINSKQTQHAMAAGADILVSPSSGVSLDENRRNFIINAHYANRVAIPTAMTSTDIGEYLSSDYKPDAIKLFHAGTVGPHNIADLLDPFSQESTIGSIFVPTGGITRENAYQFRRVIEQKGFRAAFGMSDPLRNAESGDLDSAVKSLDMFKKHYDSVR